MWQSTQQELGEGVCCPKTSISAAQIGTEDGKPYPSTGSIPDPSVFCTSAPRASDSQAQRLYLSFGTSVLQTRLTAAQPRLWLKMQDSYDISWQNSTFKPHPRVKLETEITHQAGSARLRHSLGSHMCCQPQHSCVCDTAHRYQRGSTTTVEDQERPWLLQKLFSRSGHHLEMSDTWGVSLQSLKTTCRLFLTQ